MNPVSDQRIAHRLRGIVVERGVVNVCPECGRIIAAGFMFDFDRDPCPGLGTIIVEGDAIFDFVEALQDLAVATLEVPCMPCGGE